MKTLKTIDIRSDTVTIPEPEMLEYVIQNFSKLGDDVYKEDDLVNELENRAATIFHKEAALLTTSGTQGNFLVVLSRTNRGDEIILEQNAHIFYYEAAGISFIGGVMPKLLSGENGIIDPESINDMIRPRTDIHQPWTTLVSVEQTHNRGGGTVYPLEIIDKIGKITQDNDMAFHMDGARVFNASVYLQKPVNRITEQCTTVQFCLSKGLSAPIGSLLVGSEETINKARKFRKMLGGGMRQAGVIAGPGIYALEHMVDRWKDDYHNAKTLASYLAGLSGANWSVVEPQTNIIKSNCPNKTAKAIYNELHKINIKAVTMDEYTVRVVTHANISKEDIEEVKTRIENHKPLMNLIQSA